MGSGISFRQILEEKMNTLEGNSDFSQDSPGLESDFLRGEYPFPEGNPAFETLIAQLLGNNVNVKFNSSSEHVTGGPRKVRSAYGTPPPREKSKKAPRPEKTTLVKALNAQANQALRTLVELGATELKSLELLSESGVKRAFRRLALRLHPDQNLQADGRDFDRARVAYNTLLSNFNR